MLIDGVVKRYPTAVVELDTPYYRGTTKVLCMETPVQDIIIVTYQGHVVQMSHLTLNIIMIWNV